MQSEVSAYGGAIPLFKALASCFSCQQSALSPGFVLTRGNFVESYTVTESQVILSEEMF